MYETQSSACGSSGSNAGISRVIFVLLLLALCRGGEICRETVSCKHALTGSSGSATATPSRPACLRAARSRAEKGCLLSGSVGGEGGGAGLTIDSSRALSSSHALASCIVRWHSTRPGPPGRGIDVTPGPGHGPGGPHSGQSMSGSLCHGCALLCCRGHPFRTE